MSAIQNIITDNKHFYVLANKKEQRLGYYLFSVDLNPTNQKPPRETDYMIQRTNMLDFGNCDLHYMMETVRDDVNGDIPKKIDCVEIGRKLRNDTNIVVSYKRIGINTFNVFEITWRISSLSIAMRAIISKSPY